jgi:hypothetical protein
MRTAGNNPRECVVSFIRVIGVLLLMLFLLPSTGASAGDYTVSYALDAGDTNDAGKSEECTFKYYCDVASEKLDFNILLSFHYPDRNHPKHNEVHISIRGRNGCCYFSDGVDSIVRNAGALIRINVYRGRRRIRNEFIQNEPVGILYLQFSNMK